MPFSVKDKKSVLEGKYNFAYSRWHTVTGNARDMITKLICVDPRKRISAGMSESKSKFMLDFRVMVISLYLYISISLYLYISISLYLYTGGVLFHMKYCCRQL